MQEKIESETKALELAMKLEASSIADGAAGMVKIQSQLAKLTLQLQDIKKGKEGQEEFWCTKCRMERQTKDNCPTFMNYVAFGAPNPLNGKGVPWCLICQSRGHRDEECVYLQKFVSTPANLFCKFCNRQDMRKTTIEHTNS